MASLTIIAAPAEPIPAGLVETIEAAGHLLSRAPEGWLTDDPAAVQAIITSYDGSAAQLAFARAARQAALAADYARRIAAGRAYAVPGDASGAHLYQIDELPTATRQASQQAIAAIGAQAAQALAQGVAGTVWDPNAAPGFFVIDAANRHVPMNALQACAFAADVARYCAALKLAAAELRRRIIAAESMAELAAIDLAQGWPGNP